MHAALKKPPEVAGDSAFLNSPGLGFRGSIGMYHSPEHLEQCWDACKWGRVPEDPAFSCSFPSYGDDSMSPPGYHTAYIFAIYFPVTAPREKHGRLREEMADKVIDKINR